MTYSAGRLAALLALASGCAADLDVSTTAAPSWEDFEAAAHRLDDGRYVVDGDTPIADATELRGFYDRLYGDGALIVHRRNNGTPDKWGPVTKRNLTYCVSTAAFGPRHASVVTAMATAAAAWEAAADVNFVYLAQHNASCDGNNTNVVFHVTQSSNGPFFAVAFFPSFPRAQRGVVIDTSAFGNPGNLTLAGILRHELGHTLGFRHEHTRPEAADAGCFENNVWIPLTPYDSASVMHYPLCGGSQLGDLVLTARDKSGVQALYGAPQ